MYGKYKALCELIAKYNHAYYVENKSMIADADFDCLYQELKSIEAQHPEWVTPDSPTMYVGSDLAGEGVKHVVPMLSLGKAYDTKEVLAFIRKMSLEIGRTPSLVMEHKLDGLSISLTYCYGKLVRALTRGDGNMGTDVTCNVRQIKSIPNVIEDKDVAAMERFEVRGEVLLTFAAFDSLNKSLERSGRELYQTPRNAASGILRGSSASACQMLTAMMYRIVGWEDTQEAAIKRLGDLGFRTAPCVVIGNTDYIEGIINRFDRSMLKYPIDGLVIKCNECSLYDSLGSTSTAPRWAIAYKFEENEHMTTFRKVDFRVAASGKVTPVLQYDQIAINGTRCSQATVGSRKVLEERFPDLHEGDTLVVVNKIVPIAVRHMPAKNRGAKVEWPTHCPVCGERLVVKGATYYCPRPDKHASAMADTKSPKAELHVVPTISSNALLGMRIVITGDVKGFSRASLKKFIEGHGGCVTSSVSGKTSVLICEGDSNSTKFKDAKAYGVPVMTMDELIKKYIN